MLCCHCVVVVLSCVVDVVPFTSNSSVHLQSIFLFLKIRVAKSGARVVCCEVSDSARKHVADAIRAKAYQHVKKVSSDAPTHLYIPKSFWSEKMVAEHNVEFIGIVDHRNIGLSYATADYRYSVFFVKK
jgi:hypothetical protein